MESAIVAYIDILGFKAAVNEGVNLAGEMLEDAQICAFTPSVPKK